MKLASINSSIQPKTYNNNKKPSFKGLTESVVNFWQIVDNGGRALQFTVEDMTGTNIPRSIKGLLAGKKYSGHYNIPAFLQEAIREFLTGPTMCLVPFFSITAAKKLSGKSANIETTNLTNLSYLLSEKTTLQEGKTLEESFYNAVIKDMFNKSTGKNVDEKLTGQMTELFKQLGNSTDKKAEKAIIGNIQELFEKTVKAYKDDYKNTSFSTAIYSKNAQKTGATSIQNYANYTTSYIKDIVKKYGENISKDQIENFKNSKMFKRLFLSIGPMICLTGFLMFQIPKLYTKASGMINPNASAIYDEAKKIKNGKRPEENK